MSIEILETRIGKQYWRQSLVQKANELKKKGADVDKIIHELKERKKFEYHRLLSIDSELDSLELLGEIHEFEENHRCYTAGIRKGRDHEFLQDRIAYEVETVTCESKPMKNIFGTIEDLQRKYENRGYYTQVIYGEKPLVIRQKLGQGSVKCLTEILVCTIPYQPSIVKKVMNKVEEAKKQLHEYNGRRVAIIDLRHIPFGLGDLMNIKLEEIPKLSELNGVILLVRDYNGIDLKNGFIVNPNSKSQKPISSDDYKRVLSESPINSDWAYAMPMEISSDKVGVQNLFMREKDGTFVIDGIEIDRSLVADDYVMLYGLQGLPKNLECMSLEIEEKRKWKIHFK
ncbi:MAG TPA: hypothetical protein EYP30_02920 [Archaeoglobaceae archaeon]|nr:hypothetical protein [Archaeoglobaceae archaeon]